MDPSLVYSEIFFCVSLSEVKRAAFRQARLVMASVFSFFFGTPSLVAILFHY